MHLFLDAKEVLYMCAVYADWGVVENCVASHFIYSSTFSSQTYYY